MTSPSDKQEQLTAEDWRDLYLQSQQEKLALQDRLGELTRSHGAQDGYITGQGNLVAPVTPSSTGGAMKTTLLDTIRVLESCEAKLEYLGRVFSGRGFTDRYEDGPDCLHRAHKARNAIATLRTTIAEHYAAVDEGGKK